MLSTSIKSVLINVSAYWGMLVTASTHLEGSPLGLPFPLMIDILNVNHPRKTLPIIEACVVCESGFYVERW
ncbi:hypothetical protein K443DRAFT_686548, partial [Laccaria amethystina LaAM-08-1]